MGAFHLTAEDIRIEEDHILVARLDCGNGEYQESSIDLDQYIGNADGRFEWGGENFSETAEGVDFAIEGDFEVPVLRAQLKTPSGEYVPADLNLGERIDNREGEFVFDP